MGRRGFVRQSWRGMRWCGRWTGYRAVRWIFIQCQRESCHIEDFCDQRELEVMRHQASHHRLFTDLLEDRIVGDNATASEYGGSDVKLKEKVRRRAAPNTLLLHGYTAVVWEERTIEFLQVPSIKASSNVVISTV